MNALQKPEQIAIADYLDGEVGSEVKHEYLGGQIHAMAGGTNRHNAIASSITIALGSRLRGKPCQAFNSDTKVRIRYPDHTRFYYPDAMVVCQPNPDGEHFQDQPVVVIEVLSDSTRRTDLSEKHDAYVRIPSLMALVYVESDKFEAIVHRRHTNGSFEAELHSGSDAVIPLPEIEAELPLVEVYERVAFET